MENPTASDLVKKLSRGEISRQEFDLFLEALEDKKQKKTLEQGLRDLFDKFLNVNTPGHSEKEENKNTNTL